MKTKEQAAIDREVLRLKKLPKAGVFTLLHHRGPLLEPSTDLMERVDHIVKYKPKNEVLVRLRHIRHVKLSLLPENCQKAYAERQKAYAEWKKAYAEYQKAYAEYQKADAEWKKADAEWKKADAEWEKALHEFAVALALVRKLVPHCEWNGTCISGTEGTA